MAKQRRRVTLYAALALGVLGTLVLWWFVAAHPTSQEYIAPDGGHVFLRADRRFVLQGSCATISWKAENVAWLRLDGEIVPMEGEKQSCIDLSRSYKNEHTIEVPSQNKIVRKAVYISVPLYGRTSQQFFAVSLLGLLLYSLLAWVVWRLAPAPSWPSRETLVALGTLTATVGALYWFMASSMLHQPGSDWLFWQSFANGLRDGNLALDALPHMLYPALTALASFITEEKGGVLVATVGGVLTSWEIYFMLRRPLQGGSAARTQALAVGATLVLMFVAPIFILTPQHLYLGYIPIHVYHSPTMYVLKPFALPLFIMSVYALSQRPPAPFAEHSYAALVPPALTAALAPFAKPSLAIVLVPSLGIAAAWRVLRRQKVRWGILLSLTLSTLGVLAFQYVLNFRVNSENHIQLDPLGFYRALGPYRGLRRDTWLLLPQFFLSIAFPLTVYLAYFQRARRELAFNLAWLFFLVGASYSYLLVETARLQDGNFTWSGQIALFILFIVAARFWLAQEAATLTNGRWRALPARFWSGAAVLALHFGCGVYWYITELMGLKMW